MNYEEDIKKAIEVMRQGGVILYPTDTIWNNGCDEALLVKVDDFKKVKV